MRLTMPVVTPYSVTAKYGATGLQYIRSFGVHHGVDLVSLSQPRDRTLVAAHDGVVRVYSSRIKGNVVHIQYGVETYSEYFHLSEVSVQNGDEVKAGDRVGTYGDTGTGARGKHLHWEFYLNGHRTDAMAVYTAGLNEEPPTPNEEYMMTFEDGIKDLYWDVLGRGVLDSELQALLATTQSKIVYDRQRNNLLTSAERQMAIEKAWTAIVGKEPESAKAQEYIQFQITHATPFARLLLDMIARKKELKKK